MVDLEFNPLARVALVTGPIYKAGVVPLSHLVEVLLPISEQVHVVTGNAGAVFFKQDPRVVLHDVSQMPGSNLAGRLLRHLLIELRITVAMAQVSRKVNICIFFIGGDSLLLPPLFARLSGLRTAMYFAGSSVATRELKGDRLRGVAALVSSLMCAYVNKIIVYSKERAAAWGVDKRSSKVIAAHSHFLDLSDMKMGPPPASRPKTIGFIGRFSEEKGVRNFLQSIPMVLSHNPEVKFFVAGEGSLEREIREFVTAKNLTESVQVAPWIPHEELGNALRGLRLVVMPSYTEGLPNLMIEAMATGTIVLITGVGAVPDFLTGGQTGIILPDNAPETIAATITDTMGRRDLDEIARKAREMVEKNFTLEDARLRWRSTLAEILSG